MTENAPTGYSDIDVCVSAYECGNVYTIYNLKFEQNSKNMRKICQH